MFCENCEKDINLEEDKYTITVTQFGRSLYYCGSVCLAALADKHIEGCPMLDWAPKLYPFHDEEPSPLCQCDRISEDIHDEWLSFQEA